MIIDGHTSIHGGGCSSGSTSRPCITYFI